MMETAAEKPHAQLPAERAASPIVVVGIMVIIGMVAWIILQRGSGETTASDEPEAPVLAEQAVRCQSASDTASGRATELELAADAKAERYPFDAADGVAAAQLYAQAVSCYQVGGQVAAADQVERRRSAWFASLERDYAERRLRLRVALDRERSSDTQRELKALQQLLRGRHGPYLDWLAQMQRQLEPIR